jgi:hypothetical protein
VPTNLAESDSFDANVTVPEGGDDRNSASVNVAFQALANRTKYLKARRVEDVARLDTILDPDGKIIAENGLELSEWPTYDLNPLPRIIIPLRLVEAGIFNTVQKVYRQGSKINAHSDGSNSLTLRAPILLPQGSAISWVGVGAKANASPITVNCCKIAPDKSGSVTSEPSVVTLTSTPGVINPGAGGRIVDVMLDTYETVNNVTTEYWVDIDVGSDDASDAEIYYVDVRAIVYFLSPY